MYRISKKNEYINLDSRDDIQSRYICLCTCKLDKPSL